MNLKKNKTRTFWEKIKKEETLESVYELFAGRGKIYDSFDKRIFPLAPIEGPVRLDKISHIANEKADNASENLP